MSLSSALICVQVRPATLLNCGVMHFNVHTWQAVLPRLLNFADGANWQFAHDQELLLDFFRDKKTGQREPWQMLTALPDTYNWKVRESGPLSRLRIAPGPPGRMEAGILARPFRRPTCDPVVTRRHTGAS